MKHPASTDWRRTVGTALHRTRRVTGWLLTQSGRLLQHTGQFLRAVGRALDPAPADPRRE